MTNNIANYKGTGIFIITEHLYSRGAPNWNGIGASMVQVYKMVYQLYQKQDVYLEGNLITPDTVTLWQRLKILSGAHLVQNDASDHQTCFSLDYAGSRFMATPLSSFDSDKIPAFLTKEYSLPTRKILALGSDPFPDVNIYGRKDARFVMASGGKEDPTAAAKYDSNTRQLVLVDPGEELSRLMKLLNTQSVPG
ncbi:MAG: hypothetical protein WBW72_22140 [Erwinia billingiae]|jgi:hypothetical protein|uniref:hypothetical protein n=1 Tax=Erwinia billingiae TaxID=182337 RepID=UPI001244520D|nr:hypothetical protein [Erwinia billingiae]QEW30469.1 hypothetical protein D0N50_01630 [Erwinia billingiae]